MDGPTIDSAKLQSLPRIKYLIGAGIKYIHIRESYCHVIRPKEPVMGWRNYRDLIEDEILVDLFYRVEWYQDEYNISMEKVMDKFKDCENFRGTDSWNRRADQRIEEFKAKVALKYQDLPSARYLLNHGIPVSHVQKIFNQIIKTNPKGPRITTDDYKIKIEDLFLSLIGFDEFENDKSHVEMLIRAARTHRIESEIQKLVHPEDLNQLDYWMETLKRGQKEMECKYSILLEKATPIGDETDGSADKED
uniref:HEPN_Toprim_N domain-containing protein n=1 Tax=Caenorhabditis tropicalis TaxID=1561998 RepID=A0A1I7TPK9_9PELO